MDYLIFILEEAFEEKDYENYWPLSNAKIVPVQATMATGGGTKPQLQSLLTLPKGGGECHLHVSATLFLGEGSSGLALNRTLGGRLSWFGRYGEEAA
jgi:hypothetical protein